MELVKLPQPFALRLETIRAKGYSDEEIIALLERSGSTDLKRLIDPELDWREFAEFAALHPGTVRAAVAQGYRFKFITAGGIHNLLRIRFNLLSGPDYHFDGFRFSGLKLTRQDYDLLKNMIPEHWSLPVRDGNEKSNEVRFGIELRLNIESVL